MKSPFRRPTFLQAVIRSAVCVLVGSFLAVRALAAESPSVLLQKAIFAEETEGNLEAAIKIYEGIVKETDANRSLVAQAQYRLGMCELKRGKKDEAEAAFRKIIAKFTDQTELATKARERLGEMGKSASSVVVRQVWSGLEAAGDSISRDGRYMAFIDWNSGNLAVRDMPAAKIRRVTDQGSWEKPVAYAETCAISPDGKQIAYAWFGQADVPRTGSYGLKLVSLETSAIRELVAQKTNFWISAEDWSPDGRTIAAFAEHGSRPSAKSGISIVSVADGSIREVAALTGRYNTLRFSPDGRYLAYNLRLNRGADATNDIYLVDVQRGMQKLAVEHVGQEKFLGWVPGESEIVFSSDRRGTTDLWSVRIENGEAKGPHKLLKPDVGSDLKPLGITRDGSFFYIKRSNDVRDFYAAAVDFASGKVLSPPKEAGRKYGGFNLKHSLSPDGRYLAFDGLGISDLKTGGVHEFPLPANQSLGSGVPKGVWSANGRYYVSRAWTQVSADDRRHTLLLFDQTTDETKVISMAEPKARVGFSGMEFKDGLLRYFFSVGLPATQASQPNGQDKVWWVWHDLISGQKRQQEITDLAGPGWPHGFTLTSDEKHLFYVRTVGARPQFEKVVGVCRDFATGKEVEFGHATNQFVILGEPSLDRPVLVAFAEEPGHLRGIHTIKGIDVTANSAKERFSVAIPKWTSFFPWGPFGSKSHLLFTKVTDGPEPTTELWTISSENGELKKTEFAMRDITLLGCHPDGQQIFFHKRGNSLSEIWVMENFLPPVARKN